MPLAWVAISQAARDQVRRPRWLPCSTVPAVTETWRSQAAHCKVSRSRLSSQASPWPQAGQRNPSGHRFASSQRAQAASSGNRASNSGSDRGSSVIHPPPKRSGTTYSVAGTKGMSHSREWLIPLSPTCYPVLERDRRDGVMTDFPRSLPEFERRFPDEAACAEWLLERRWGSGFACPECGHDRFWRLGRKVLTLQCRACRRETSVTAGTVMHRSHLPLKVWFTAAWLVATHKNGMSARQLWLQLGLGSYKSAWLLLRKLRAAMVDPNREPLGGLVEVDETSLPFRSGGEPARPGRSHEGKLLIAGAVEIEGKGPGRTRLAVIGDYAAASLGGFVGANVADGSTVVSDGWSGYAKLKDVKHDPRVVGDAPAHLILPWVHRVFANAKRWALGVYHGLREEHLQAYLDEFVFRFNRRRTPQAAFARLLGLAVTIGPHPYDALVAMGSKG